MKNPWIPESLYDVILKHLNHNRCCVDCGDRLWIGYTDGHVWDKCFNCDEPSRSPLDLAGYITTYPVPVASLPESLEVRDIEGYKRLDHEKYYRKKDSTLPVQPS